MLRAHFVALGAEKFSRDSTVRYFQNRRWSGALGWVCPHAGHYEKACERANGSVAYGIYDFKPCDGEENLAETGRFGLVGSFQT
jgi:hypothetical protein